MSYITEGVLFIESGDVISGTVLDGFGSSAATSGSASGLLGAIVDSGGTLVAADIIDFGGVGVNTGGLAIDTVVTDGLLGVEGVASNSLVLNSGIEEVAYGGVTIGTTIEGGDSLYGGGLLWVSSGGVASDTTVSGGTFALGGGVVVASAVNTTVSGGVFDLDSGAVASATTVVSGGMEVVNSGAFAGDTTVSAGGTEEILTSGAAGSVTVLSGGTLTLMGAPVTPVFTVASGGTLIIGTDFGGGSGGTSPAYTLSNYIVNAGVTVDVREATGVGLTVSSGGIVNVNFSGTAIDTTVSSGGTLVVSGGFNAASGTTIDAGGTEIVFGTGDSGTTISGGEEIVSDGYVAGATVSSGGTLVLSSAEGIGTIVGAGGEEIVYGSSGVYGVSGTVSATVLSGGRLDVVGGVASGTFISGGEMVVSSGGEVFGATVAGGGTLVILSGAQDDTIMGFNPIGFTTVSDGTEIVQGSAASIAVEGSGTLSVSGGWVNRVAVNSGGSLVIASGGETLWATASSGGEITVSGGGTDQGGTLSGGVEVVDSGGTANGVAISGGGRQVIQSGGVAENPAIYNGTLELAGGSVVSGPLNFLNDGTGTDTLVLDASTSFHTMVGGFGAGDQIDLADIAFVTGKKNSTHGTFTNSAGSGTLSVTDGTHTANIQLFNNYIASEFVAQSDGHGGTLITFTSATPSNGNGHSNAITVAVTS